MAIHSNSENLHPAGSGAQLNSKPSNSSTIATLCGSPYVHVQNTSGAESSNWRASRLPMLDRKNDLNTIGTSCSFLSSTGYVKLSLSRSSFDDMPLRPVQYAPAIPFQPLPPLPCASSLQLPSFMESPTRTPGLPLEMASHPLTPASVAVPKQPVTQEGTFPPSLVTPAETSKLLVNINIPSFMHPNSPYVPWTPEIRREVLCPFVAPSPVSDFYACPYSHTVARAPKPRHSNASRPRNGSKLTKVSKRLRNLTSVVGKNIKQVAKQISRLKKSQSTTNSQAPTSCDHVPVASNSFDSSDATTLSAWLRNCQQARLEHEGDAPWGMSLDDYERMGSWTNLSGPGTAPKNEFLDTTSAMSQSWRQTHHARPRSSTLPRSLSRFHSHSDSQVVGSLRISSPTSEDAPTGTLSRRDRELSMPGGWTFSH